MKKRIPHRQVPGKNVRKGRQARTGEHCPIDGWWMPGGREAEAQYIAEGSIMPPSNSQSVTWTLAAARMRVHQPRHTHPAPGASLDSL